MMTRAIRIAAVASFAAALPGAAQGAGAVEIGAFARYTDFDRSLAMNNAVGVGAEAAVSLERAVALEVDVSRTTASRPGGGSVTYTPVHVRLVAAVATGNRLDVLLGGGAVRNAYGGGLDASDGGVSALLGLRYRLSDRMCLRGGFDGDFMLHTGSAQGSPFTFYSGNWGLQLGAVLRLKGGGGAQP
jgi:hypothetical protein